MAEAPYRGATKVTELQSPLCSEGCFHVTYRLLPRRPIVSWGCSRKKIHCSWGVGIGTWPRHWIKGILHTNGCECMDTNPEALSRALNRRSCCSRVRGHIYSLLPLKPDEPREWNFHSLLNDVRVNARLWQLSGLTVLKRMEYAFRARFESRGLLRPMWP